VIKNNYKEFQNYVLNSDIMIDKGTRRKVEWEEGWGKPDPHDYFLQEIKDVSITYRHNKKEITIPEIEVLTKLSPKKESVDLTILLEEVCYDNLGFNLGLLLGRGFLQNITIKNNNLYYNCSISVIRALELLKSAGVSEGIQIERNHNRKEVEKQEEDKKEKVLDKKRTKKISGYVYYVQSDSGTKIGLSTKIKERTDYITTIMPCNWIRTDVFAVNDRFKAEKRLHKEFHSKRFKGEWFYLDLEDFSIGEQILKEDFKGKRVDKNTESYEETYKKYPNVLDKSR
jgi:hypothetical protein